MAFVNHIRTQKYYKVRRETLPSEYRRLFRFNEENVHWLANHFIGERNEKRGAALTSDQKMKVFLRYVSDPGYQNSVAEVIGIKQSTVSKTIADVKNRILTKANVWIKFPTSNEEIREAKQLWQEHYDFPGVIGVVDCTHVRIPKPSDYGDEYINRKGFASINVQATCDAVDRFSSVDVQWPGSTHDSRIWRNSNVSRIMRANRQNAVLLGDEGYGVEACLMTPYRNPNTPQQIQFNNLLKRERVCIERCFGQLKQRFPIMQYKVRLKLVTIPEIIVCCVVLHNIAKFLQDPDFDPENVILENNGIVEEHIIGLNNNDNYRRLGLERRGELAQLIFERDL